MCVVALAWNAHPRWRVVMAGNRDEFHARPSAPLTRWDGMIAGRDLTGGGTWAGVSEAGRLAVIVNVRGDPPDPEKLSRGGLVTGALAGQLPGDLERFNRFALLAVDGTQARLVTNAARPAVRDLAAGIHSLSNGAFDELWPRKAKVEAALVRWLPGGDDPAALLTMLADEADCGEGNTPVFIRAPVYGTRASTVVAVDSDGRGMAVERIFGPDGMPTGQTAVPFAWPSHA